MLHVTDSLQASFFGAETVPSFHLQAFVPNPIVTDLTVCISPSSLPELKWRVWYRIQKDLYLHTLKQSAWLSVALAREEELVDGDLLVTDVRVEKQQANLNLGHTWESRPGGLWVLRSKFVGKTDHVVTGVDVLFGDDAVDPRPQWTLMQLPLQLDVQSVAPVARLTVLRGRLEQRRDARAPLRVKDDGKFKIVQLSDMHMVTGVGVCMDAIDAQGNHLPECKADPLTVSFIRDILDVEKPDLVIFTRDQLHHDISDSQSALFKRNPQLGRRSNEFFVLADWITGSAQMAILQDLPLSYCEPGPEHVDSVGNYYLRVLAPAPSRLPASILYFLDSHGRVPHNIFDTEYEPVKQSQIDWFVGASQAQRGLRDKNDGDDTSVLSLAFFHIPLPEVGDSHLSIRSGQRGQPIEGPGINSHFYDALAKEGILAVGCGHDHVNDFCAQLPYGTQQDGHQDPQARPWLCYGGSCGFGGYGSYNEQRFYRRSRVWELDTRIGSWKTWKRVEYAMDRIDELLL